MFSRGWASWKPFDFRRLPWECLGTFVCWLEDSWVIGCFYIWRVGVWKKWRLHFSIAKVEDGIRDWVAQKTMLSSWYFWRGFTWFFVYSRPGSPSFYRFWICCIIVSEAETLIFAILVFWAEPHCLLSYSNVKNRCLKRRTVVYNKGDTLSQRLATTVVYTWTSLTRFGCFLCTSV